MLLSPEQCQDAPLWKRGTWGRTDAVAVEPWIEGLQGRPEPNELQAGNQVRNYIDNPIQTVVPEPKLGDPYVVDGPTFFPWRRLALL